MHVQVCMHSHVRTHAHTKTVLLALNKYTIFTKTGFAEDKKDAIFT